MIYPQEKLNRRLDLRSFYLRLARKWRVPFFCAAMGAFLGLVIYVLVTTVLGPGRLYQAESMLYITFAPEMAESAYPYYNDYTWRDLITTDEIMEATCRQLQHEGYQIMENSDPLDMGSRILSESEIRETVYVTLPSDIRLMRAEFTNHDPVIANVIMESMDKALVQYGEAHEEFASIEIRKEEVAHLVTYTDRRWAAIILGGVLGFLFGLFFITLKELLNDAVYTPLEASTRFSFPVRGTLLKENKDTPLTRFLSNELRMMGEEMAQKGRQTIGVVAGADVEETDAAKRACTYLQKHMGTEIPVVFCALPTPGSDGDIIGRLQETDAVLLLVPFGVNYSTRVEHCIDALEQAKASVAGILLQDAEEKFLAAYYFFEKGKARQS